MTATGKGKEKDPFVESILLSRQSGSWSQAVPVFWPGSRRSGSWMFVWREESVTLVVEFHGLLPALDLCSRIRGRGERHVGLGSQQQ